MEPSIFKPNSSNYIRSFYLIKRIVIFAIGLFLIHNASANTSIVSIVRSSPLIENTAATSVTFAVTFDGVVTGVDPSDFIVTVTGISGAYIMDVTGSDYNYYVTVNTGSGDGTIRLDLISGPSISPAITNAPFTSGELFTVDKTVPAAPLISGITNDSGTNTSDGVTNDQTLIVTGIAEANVTVTLHRMDVGDIGTAQADESGNWTFDYTYTALPEGTHTFSAIAEDKAGNVSIKSTDFVVKIDFTAYPPTILRIKDDTGLSNTDEITNYPAVVLYGISEFYATVVITRSGTEIYDTVYADINGNWTFDYSNSILNNGKHTFFATIVDAAGNISSASSNFIITIDMVAPAAPSINEISLDAGFSGSDRITNDQTLIFQGSSEAYSLIMLNRTGLGVIGSTNTGGNGAWIFDYSGTILPEGSHTFTAVAIDLAGNVGPVSENFTVTIETTVPTAPSILSFSDDTGPDNTDRITNDQTISISGTAEANSLITITRAGTGIFGICQTDVSGSWTFDHTGTSLANGSYDLILTAMDIAGNVSNLGTSFLMVIDAIAPQPVISSLDANPTPSSTITIQIEFSENVLNFTIDDISIIGGTKSNFIGSGSMYTLEVISSGTDPFTIDIAANTAIDNTGNGNTASSFQIVYGPCTSPVISVSPSDQIVCEGAPLSFSVEASGDNLSYQWSVDEGSGFILINNEILYTGSNSSILSIPGSMSSMNNYTYKCTVTGTCAPSAASGTALLTVKPLPDVTFSLNGNNTACSTSPVITLPEGSPATGVYTGNGVSGGTFDPFLAGIGNHTITYTYTGVNGCANSAFDVMSVTVCTNVLATHLPKDVITIFPNPVHSTLTVSCISADNLLIELSNAQGKNFLHSNLPFDQNDFDVNDYPVGIYLIRIWKGNELIRQEKVIKY